jgi:hypothetical protein
VIVNPKDALPLCEATVDLISKRQRPWLFRVTVVGKPPHAERRVYEIAAKDDNTAAMTGIDRFVKEFSHPLRILDVLKI